MSNCVILVSDENYLEHSKALFVALKTVGCWEGEYCLIGNGLSTQTIEYFENRGITVINHDKGNSFFAKYNLFDYRFNSMWKKILYFDADFVITGNINKLVTDKVFTADFENANVKDWFSPELDEDQGKFLNTFPNVKGFNTGFMAYDTSIINENTCAELHDLQSKLSKVNTHVNEGGTDQPIINLYFDQVSQVEGVSFHRDKKNGDVALHTCRWEAPWKDFRYVNYYKNNLSNFENVFSEK